MEAKETKLNLILISDSSSLADMCFVLCVYDVFSGCWISYFYYSCVLMWFGGLRLGCLICLVFVWWLFQALSPLLFLYLVVLGRKRTIYCWGVDDFFWVMVGQNIRNILRKTFPIYPFFGRWLFWHWAKVH